VSEANSRTRLLVIGAIVVALFGGLLTRLWFLQVNGGQQLAVQAQRNGEQIVSVPAVRGTIYDDQGNILAQTQLVSSLVVDRQKLTESDRFTLEQNLGALLHIDGEAVDKLIDNPQYQPFVPVPVAENINTAQAVYVVEHRDLFPHTEFTHTAVRTYPNGPVAADVLGYTGRISDTELAAHKSDGYTALDTIGKTGVEQTFESELRGEPGTDKVEVDSRGDAVDTVEAKKPQAGHDVQLTIDLPAQKIAEESLAQGMDGARGLVDPDTGNYYQANAGAVVVLNAQDGSVVAMASNPSYDPNQFIAGNADQYFNDPAKPLLNRALNQYAPGSTFKAFTSIAMLQSGLYPDGADHTYDDEGCFKFGNDQQICNAGKHALGTVNLPRALTVSSDVYFYSVGNDIWNHYRDECTPGTTNQCGDNTTNHPVGYAIQNVAKTYGFGAPTGVGLAGDASGRIPDHAFREDFNKNSPDPIDRTWRRGDSANLAVGQGDVLVTPLQLANGYAAIANGGTLYMPRLVGSVHDNSTGLPPGQLGALVRPIDAQTKNTTALNPAVRQPIVDGLTGVVNDADGTANGAFADYVGPPVIGKTGTAQITNGEDTSWFVGVTNPANDPALGKQYVVLAMVEQGGFGASVAAPIVRRVIDYLNNPAVPPAPVSVAPASGNEQSF
jgi:penicillin-binding protein 2